MRQNVSLDNLNRLDRGIRRFLVLKNSRSAMTATQVSIRRFIS
jgi:hypothetical protein